MQELPPEIPLATALQAAFAALPDPTVIIEASGPLVFANAAWQKRPGAMTPPPGPEQLTDGLSGRWGAPAQAVEQCQAACLELRRDATGTRELAWQHAGFRYRLTLSCIGGAQLLAVLKDVTAAEQQAASLLQVQQQLDEAMQRFDCFAAVTSETLVVSERGKILFVNTGTSRMFLYSQVEIVGKSILDFAAPECHAEIIRYLTADNDDAPYEAVCVRADGTRFPAEVRGRLISYHGRPVRGAAILDISKRRRAEALLNQKLREEERIRTQAETLLALSTPLIPISDDVLVMPLIGTVDGNRMARVTETLLAGITQRRVRWAIVDITGLPTLDSATATGLLRAAQAARLVGAQVIVSGVRAEVAQELVRLGADLTSLTTRSSVQSAIAFALGHVARRPAAPTAR